MKEKATSKSRDGVLIVIDSHDALTELRASLWMPWLPSASRIELDKSFISEGAEELENRLNDFYLDCGCDVGAVAVGLAAVGFVAWLLGSSGSLGWAMGIRGAIILLAAAFVGKVAGLVRNRFVLASLIARIEESAPRRSEGSS